MTPAEIHQAQAAATDRVRAALEDPGLRMQLYRHALARLGQVLSNRPRAFREEIAAEAVQEAFARAFERQNEFNPAQLPVPGPWIHGILERVLQEHVRSLRKQPAQPAADPVGWENVTAQISDPNRRGELMKILEQLPEDQRRIVQLHHLEGMTHEQIAATQHISVACSRVRLARAMQALRSIAAKGGGQ